MPAILSVASGRPRERIFPLMSSSVSGWCSSSLTRPSRLSAVNSGSSRSLAPPASARTRAFYSWWLFVTCGLGISTAGLPMAVSSARVLAPARHMTRSAAAMTRGMS